MASFKMTTTTTTATTRMFFFLPNLDAERNPSAVSSEKELLCFEEKARSASKDVPSENIVGFHASLWNYSLGCN